MCNVPLLLAIWLPAATPFVTDEIPIPAELNGELQLLLAMVRFMNTDVALVSLYTPPPKALPVVEKPVILPLAGAPTAEFCAIVQFVAASCAALKIPPPNPAPPTRALRLDSAPPWVLLP